MADKNSIEKRPASSATLRIPAAGLWGDFNWSPKLPYLILPANHYASEWSQDREIRDTDAVTGVAVQYVKETNPAKKEELLLELVRFFHSYVFKYVSMIVSGTLPKNGHGVNRDLKLFLRMFVPSGTSPVETGWGTAPLPQEC